MSSGLDSVTLTEVSLEGPDGDGAAIDLVTTAGVLTGCVTDAATNRGKGVGLPGNQVAGFRITRFHRIDVAAGIRMNRASGLATHQVPVI
jgi:hypothetical protein